MVSNDLHPSLAFLSLLDSSAGASFNIECYTDSPSGIKKPKPDPLLRRHANLSNHDAEVLIPELEALNANGAAVYVARNQCSGHRNEANVSRVRGLHADLDHATKDQFASLRARLDASLIVETSPGRCQLYWQLAEGESLTKDEAKQMNQLIVKVFGADPAAVDVARLLRVPGFRHMKYRADGKTPTVRVTSVGPTYSARELREAFAVEVSLEKCKRLGQRRPSESDSASLKLAAPTEEVLLDTRIKKIVKEVSSRHEKLWAGDWDDVIRSSGEIGYPSQSEADLALASHIVRACRMMGINETDIQAIAEKVFTCSTLGRSEKWAERADYRERTIGKAIDGLAHATDTPSAQSDTAQISDRYVHDIARAKRFADTYDGEIKFVPDSGKWIRWTGNLWRPCELGEEVEAAKEVAAKLLSEAILAIREGRNGATQLLKDASNAHRAERIRAMLTLASSDPRIAVSAKALDANPMLLGCRNGTIDLQTGALLAPDPSHLITKQVNASCLDDPVCPRWERFLHDVFQGDMETITSVQVLLGYTLIGEIREERIIICTGFGANGKSVFQNVIFNILDGYAKTAPSSMIAQKRGSDQRPRDDIASLVGARYVGINETEAGDHLDEQTVKRLAGREPLAVRHLYGKYFSFTPSFKIWLRTNHKPIIKGDDHAIWRRLIVISFNRTFALDEQDPLLEGKLLEEADGILGWLLEGVRLYLKEGIRLSPRMNADLASYRSDSDLMGEFLADVTTSDPNGKVRQGELFGSYQNWCQNSGLRAMTKKSFTQRLAERGIRATHSGKDRHYVGVTLNGADDSWRLQIPQVGVEGAHVH